MPQRQHRAGVFAFLGPLLGLSPLFSAPRERNRLSDPLAQTTSLESACAQSAVNVDSKEVRLELSPLDATLTKKRGVAASNLGGRQGLPKLSPACSRSRMGAATPRS